MTSPARRAVATDQQVALAVTQINRFSTDLTELFERVVGTVSNHEAQVLTHLYAHPSQRPAQLIEVTGLTRPSVATLVGRLERMGLVERSFGKDDRRTTLASLTIRGRRRMRQLDAEFEAMFERQRGTILAILEHLGCDGSVPIPARKADDTALALVGRLTAAGAALEQHIGAPRNRMHRRQRVALSVLFASGSARAGELAEVLHLSSGGLTYLIDQLVDDGLVVRAHGQVDDRRAVVMDLSENGREVARSIAAAVAATSEEICSAFRSTLAPRAAAPV